MVTSVALSLPEKEVSAWVTETSPKEARAWLASLPLADAGESGRDIYQALYTLNRLELPPQTRLELMELYRTPVATVSSLLTSQFSGLALPLAPTIRQLAEFIRQLQMEMGIGYKCALHDLQTARIAWGKKHQVLLATQRALWYLGEILLRSYQVYMPQPANIWKEVHALYRFAEAQGKSTQAIEVSDDKGSTTISQRYLQIVLLGLCNPYQLPQNECNHVNEFLETRAQQALISNRLAVIDPAGHFLIDLSVDGPPVPFQQPPPSSGDVRVLNAIEIARTVHSYIKRLEQGESAASLGLGADLSDSAGRDMLRRMIKFWGLTPKRQYSRTKIRGHLSLCTGINAIHFFSGGRKPFNPPDAGERLDWPRRGAVSAMEGAQDAEVEIKDSQPREAKPEAGPKTAVQEPPRWLAEAKLGVPETFPVDRWQLRDESARGLLLSRKGDMGVHVRVGDVLGIQGPTDAGMWRVGVIRWIKSPDAEHVEMGVERLAPEVTPVAVRPVGGKRSAGEHYAQGLLLPAMPVLQRPATLLVARGVYEPDRDLYIADGDEMPRVVRALKLLERTASFDQIVFAELSAR